jgi:hypothetical protein
VLRGWHLNTRFRVALCEIAALATRKICLDIRIRIVFLKLGVELIPRIEHHPVRPGVGSAAEKPDHHDASENWRG